MGPWAPRYCRGCRWLVTPLDASLETKLQGRYASRITLQLLCQCCCGRLFALPYDLRNSSVFSARLNAPSNGEGAIADGPVQWNTSPSTLQQMTSYEQFRRHLKAHFIYSLGITTFDFLHHTNAFTYLLTYLLTYLQAWVLVNSYGPFSSFVTV